MEIVKLHLRCISSKFLIGNWTLRSRSFLQIAAAWYRAPFRWRSSSFKLHSAGWIFIRCASANLGRWQRQTPWWASMELIRQAGTRHSGCCRSCSCSTRRLAWLARVASMWHSSSTSAAVIELHGRRCPQSPSRPSGPQHHALTCSTWYLAHCSSLSPSAA